MGLADSKARREMWAKLSPEAKRDIMSARARKGWANMEMRKRKALAMKLSKARWANKV